MFSTAALIGFLVSGARASKPDKPHGEAQCHLVGDGESGDNSILVSEEITKNLLLDNCEGLFRMIDGFQSETQPTKPGHCFKVNIPGRDAPIIILGSFHEAGNNEALEPFYDDFKQLLADHAVEQVFFEIDLSALSSKLTRQCEEQNWAKTHFDYGLYLKVKDLEIHGLENVEVQHRAIAAVAECAPKEYTPSQKEKQVVQLYAEMLRDSYSHGNRQVLGALYCIATAHGLSTTVFDERNLKWHEKLSALNDQPVALVVGAGHLYGPTGLLNFYLRQHATIEILDVWGGIRKIAQPWNGWSKNFQFFTHHLRREIKMKKMKEDSLKLLARGIVLQEGDLCTLSGVEYYNEIDERTRKLLHRYSEHDKEAIKMLEAESQKHGLPIPERQARPKSVRL